MNKSISRAVRHGGAVAAAALVFAGLAPISSAEAGGPRVSTVKGSSYGVCQARLHDRADTLAARGWTVDYLNHCSVSRSGTWYGAVHYG